MPAPVPGPDTDILAAFRFSVVFMIGGAVPNPIDIRFQRVSGLSAEITTTTLVEGGQNLYAHRLPERADYGNLVLERGLVLASPLNLQNNLSFSLFEFKPSSVLVTLHGEEGEPLSAWLFLKAYPVSWSTSDLDATKKEVLIDSLELAYSRMQRLSV
jgi:phage tail-like protein